MSLFSRRYARQIDIALLLLGYLIGLNLFAAFKMAGIDPSYLTEYAFRFHWWQPSIAGLLVGISLAWLEYGLFDAWSRRWVRSRLLLLRLVVTLPIVAGWMVLINLLRLLVQGEEEALLNKAIELLLSPVELSVLAFLMLLSAYLSFIRQLGNHFGHGILLNFITGKYSRPREEEQAFLFIDLKDSTSWAERLGHVRYSELIHTCFQDLSELLGQHQAEIYQFVGDEAVLYWDARQGKIPAEAFTLFAAFQQRLVSQKESYLRTFGAVPTFKAAMHVGLVAATQIGHYKSELAFHGDVLNTTSRILEMCSQLKKQFLVSEAVALQMQKIAEIKLHFIENFQLRGKETSVGIYEVQMAVSARQQKS